MEKNVKSDNKKVENRKVWGSSVFCDILKWFLSTLEIRQNLNFYSDSAIRSESDLESDSYILNTLSFEMVFSLMS